jgi:zinc transporter ZupT
MNLVPSLIAVVGLAIVHVIIGELRFLEGTPRSRWLSIAGGVSVAYVFIHLLPELGERQEVLAEALAGTFSFLESHVYLVALAGLVVFYGLDRLAKTSRQQQHKQGEGDTADLKVFWLHIASFGVYNALIGYLLLHRERPGLRSLVFFFIAMALHFVVTDYGLHTDYKRIYQRIGRWVLVAAVLIGWGIGLVTEISAVALAVLVAFLAGGVVLNVLKEELPEERESRFSAFVLGVAGYTALLLAL